MRKKLRRRVRRTAEDARAAILDAAEKKLAEVGPGGIRLQEVAAEVGVSHPTVLHHFGSREALVHAVVERSVGALERDLLLEIAKSPIGTEPVVNMLESAARVLGPGGHARVIAWLALAGHAHHGPTGFDTVAGAAHELRKSRHAARGVATPPYEDTYFTVLLAGLALFGDAIAGSLFRGDESASTATRARSSARFRKWLAPIIESHLEQGAADRPHRPSH